MGKAIVKNEVAATDVVETRENNDVVNDVADEPIVKTGCRKVRIKDFRGSFGNAKFDDNCTAEVDDETVELIRKHFPECEIEDID